VGPFAKGLSERAALRGETARWNYSVDEAPRRENLWRQDGGCEHHLRGASYADPRCDALGSARIRDASCNRLDLPDLTALCSPDQIARKARLERARVALAVDECEGRDRQILDRLDQGADCGAQLPSVGFINTDEDRELCPCGEVITLGSHEHGARVAAGRVVDRGAQIGQEFTAEEVLRRAVGDDLAEVIDSLEGSERHRQPQCPE
jgi:hypothetical protein